MRSSLQSILRNRQRPLTDDYQVLAYNIGCAAILAQRAARPSMRALWDAEVSVYSQWGEDGILDFLCDLSGLSHPRVIEFGAGDFTECNSRFLADFRCAQVAAVDARPELEQAIRGRSDRWKTSVLPIVEWVTPETAVNAFRQAEAAFGGIDIVSVDLDGNDFWVIQALPLTGVQIVVCEFNPAFGYRHPISIPRDDSFDRTKAHYSWLYFGASLRAFVNALGARGFSFVGTNRACNNAFFLRRLPEGLPFNLPSDSLSPFTNFHFREGRSPDGSLSYEDPVAVLMATKDLPVVNTVTGEVVHLENILGDGNVPSPRSDLIQRRTQGEEA